MADRFAVAPMLIPIAVSFHTTLTAAAGTIGGGLFAHVLTWRAFFAVPGAIAVVAAFGLRRVPESLTARSTENPIRQIASVLRHGSALILLGLAVLDGAVMFGFITYLAPALEAGGSSPAIAGAVVAGYGLSVLICTRAFGRVARHAPAALLL